MINRTTNHDSPPSVVIIINGVETPVVVISFVKDFAVGRSRLASMIMQSVIGASTKTDASAGRIRTSCCSKPRAGNTSADAPVELVSIRIFAIRVVRIHS